MATTRNHLTISAARANALFASPLQRSEEPSPRQLRLAIAVALRQFGDRGCAERVAQEFGDHPELAAPRMRWARRAITVAFDGSTRPQPTAQRAHQQPAGRAA